MSFHKNLRGKDLHAPSSELVENNTGATLSKLKVVTLDGMGTVYPKIKVNNSAVDNAFGIVQEDILNGKSGYVTCLGFMFDIDTSAWVPNTPLYSDISGNLTTVPQGNVVAEVISQSATIGIIYVFAVGNFMTSPSISNKWLTTGNSSLSGSSFLGTLDNVALKFRTNNTQVGQFDVNGRLAVGAHDPQATLHIKPYSGYTDSGLRVDPFALTSSVITPANAYTFTLANNQVVRLKFQISCRQNDGAARASFTRSALFYKEGGNVLIQGVTWQSDFTSKSNTSFDVSYVLGVNTVTFKVKNANAVDTYWSGHVEAELIGGVI